MASSKRKLLALAELLYRETDEDHRLSGYELEARLNEAGIEAERKSLYRDIAALQEAGLPVVKSTTGFYWSERALSIAELRTLMSAVQSAAFISNRKTKDLQKKLRGIASRPQKRELNTPAVGCAKYVGGHVFDTIERVNQAITNRKQISFLYMKMDARGGGREFAEVRRRLGERYVVSPYALIWMQDRYYLVANMNGREELTHFRLDRIRGVREEPVKWRHFSEVSAYKEEFDISDYARKCVNMYGGEAERILLWCAHDLAGEIADRFGTEYTIKDSDAFGFTVEVTAVPGKGLLNWAGQFGPEIEILRPESLRSEMHKRLLAAAKRYEF
ncbi:MAG: WYL domain-containing protein [Clostridia bacterium]|nr:WYL domain-containing protein [Clostridia bacterium]